MSARPLIVGLLCMLVGIFLILLFFKKFYAPLALTLKATHALHDQASNSGAGGAGDKFRFSSDIEKRMKQFSADQAHKTQIALAWEGLVDLDLHCWEPGGEEIFYGHKVSRTGARLDVDMNASGRNSVTPLEHIYFNDHSMLPGQYDVSVMLFNWAGQPQTPVSFHLEILKEGRAPVIYEGSLAARSESQHFTFTYP